MKILVFSDIHGNSVPFKKLLQSNDYKNADLRIFIGDIITLGPDTNECVELLRENDIIPILGNNDSYVVNFFPEREQINPKKVMGLLHRREVLKAKNKKFIQSFKKEVEFCLLNKKLLFTHYIWEDDTNVVKNPVVTNKNDVVKIFKDKDYDYIFYGHEHIPAMYKEKNKTLIGVGSLGVKHKGNYVVIDITDKISIRHKKIYYDYDKVLENFKNYNDEATQSYYKYAMTKDFLNNNNVLKK